MTQSVASPTGKTSDRGAKRHGGTLLVELLAEHGVRRVFGVPGGQTIALYDALVDRDDMAHVLVRDERTAAYAADGYARATGLVGVCDATVGPGAAKLPSGLGESLGASVPVVALVSELPAAVAAHRYRGAASQALDQAALLAPVTKWVGAVPSAAEMPAMVRHAFRVATTGRPGPVALLLPQDVLDGEAPAWTEGGGARYGGAPAARVAPDPADVAAAAAVLQSATRPFILAGGGALHSGAATALGKVAARLSAAVATTLSGKGAIGETDPLAVGVVGIMGTTAARTALEEADVVLLVGAKASGGSTFSWTLPRADQHVVQLDIDPAECGRAFGLAASMVGDARLGLDALLAALGPTDTSPSDRSAWRARIGELTAAWRKVRDEERESAAMPIAPQRVMAELERALGPEDLVVLDASLASGWGCVFIEQPEAGRRVLSPRGLAGLGYALPAAIGTAVARPGARSVVVTGDGALGYALGEMASVLEHRLPLTIVVLNNGSLGWIRWYRRIMYGRGWEKPDFSDVPFAAVAQAMGWSAERVEDPARLGAALRRAMDADGPSLVDVVSETWQTPLGGHRRALDDGDSAVGYGG